MDLHILNEDIQKAGYNQVSLGTKINCHPSYVSRLFRGRRRFTIEILARICKTIKQPIYKYFPADDVDKIIFSRLPGLTTYQKRALLRFLTDQKISLDKKFPIDTITLEIQK